MTTFRRCRPPWTLGIQRIRWWLSCACWMVLPGLLLPAVAAPGNRQLLKHSGSLLQKATRILVLDRAEGAGSDEPGGGYEKGGVDYPWLSDQALLHFKSNGRLYRYDLTTKVDSPLTALTRQVTTSGAYLYFLDASPDGQWVLWGQSANNPFFVAAVDGSRRLQWPGNQGLSGSYWCADSRHWMEFQFSAAPGKLRWTHILLHSLDTPAQSQNMPVIPEGLNGLDILAVVSPDLVIARTPDPVKTLASHTEESTAPDGGVSITSTELVMPRDKQEISVWSLHNKQPLHRWELHLPGVVGEIAVSPQGDQAAWLLVPVPAGRPHPAVLRRLSVALWVSNLDGSRMRKIGTFDKPIPPINLNQFKDLRRLPSMKVRDELDMPSGVRWLPGGRTVSFLYRGAIWIVPIP